MGKLNKGILGGFSGTVGTVIGGSWKGISYIRSLPTISKSAPSPAQLEQRAKFKTVVDFIKTILPLLRVSFTNISSIQTGFNKAFSVNYKNALQGAYPALGINYSLAQVSNGDLVNVLAPAAVAAANGVVNFNWTDNTGVGQAKADDQMMLVVHCPSLNLSIYTGSDSLRSDGTASVDCRQFSGKTVHTWISAAGADGKDAAMSIYTGEVVVS
jgi:hypothetical protein